MNHTVNGILLLDKPSDCSSNQILQKVRKIYQADKAGHAGALDPLATGMLPICFGHATKVNTYLLQQSKAYRAVVRLGERRDTLDIEGKVLQQTEVGELAIEKIQQVLQSFVGEFWQLPPQFSALKHQGKPLYYYARQGITIDKPKRLINIHQITLLDYSAPSLTIEVSCSKGVYIRSLARDIGDLLDCGGCIEKLHRIYCDPFKDYPLVSYASLLEHQEDTHYLQQQIHATDIALNHLPNVYITQEQLANYLNGQPISLEPNEQLVSLSNTADHVTTTLVKVSFEQQFIGIAHLDFDSTNELGKTTELNNEIKPPPPTTLSTLETSNSEASNSSQYPHQDSQQSPHLHQQHHHQLILKPKKLMSNLPVLPIHLRAPRFIHESAKKAIFRPQLR